MGQLCRKVLLVEDSNETREQVKKALEVWGYAVETAADGVEALRILGRHPSPDVVLLDLFLPLMSGWEVVAEMNKNERLSTIPLVILLGCLYEEADFLPPADAHLRKPVNLSRLRHVVGKLCQGASDQVEAVPPLRVMRSEAMTELVRIVPKPKADVVPLRPLPDSDG